MHELLTLLSGGLVGFSLGLIGGGGSILATPLLLYVVGVPQPHLAIGTSALVVSINAFANLVSHARAGHVKWRQASLFAVVGVGGALLGSTVGKATDGDRLLFLFALLMVVVGILMLRGRAAEQPETRPLTWANGLRLLAAALAVGFLSGFFGIGGGFLIVPGLLVATGMPMISAIGSSLLAVGTFGLATAANYAASHLVAWSVVPLFFAGGVAGGIGGMRLATRLRDHRNALNVIFASVIFLVAAYMLYRNATALGVSL